MPPNNALIRDYATFGDLTQRDLYHRHKNQVIKQGAVENYFAHLDESNAKVDTAIEKVSFDGSLSKYELYTKPAAGAINYAAQGSMLEITTAKTYVRSAEFEAAGNVAFGNMAVTGSGSFGGALGVTGATTLSSTLDVTGDATLSSDLAVSGNAAVTGTLGVTGATTLSSDLTVSGNAAVSKDLAVTGDAAISGNASVSKDLAVTGDASIASDLTVSGNAAVSKDFAVSGDAAVTGTLGVTGATALSSTLDVTGATNLTGTLAVAGATNFGDSVVVAGYASVGSTLTVVGATTLSDSLTVTGATTLSSDLTVSGNASVSKNLAVSGNTSVTGTLGVTGATTLSSDLTVSGNAAVSKDFAVSGDSVFTGNASVSGNLTVSGRTSLQDLTVNGLTTSIGNVSMSSDLTVSGNATVSQNLTVSGSTSIAGNTAIAGNLTVTGVTTLGDLTVNGLTTQNGNVYLTGNTTIASLILQGQSGFSGNVNMNENEILNVSALEQDNVRVALDGTAKTITLQTRADGSSAWDSEVTVSTTGMAVANNVTMSGDVLMNGPSSATVSIPSANVSITGPQVTLGSESTSTNLTLWGNLDIKGTATNTRIESNLVQVGDLNIELGYLEVNTLSNLNGAGLTIGGAGGSIALRPNLVFASADSAWMPNIDIITKGAETARMNTAGYFVSSLTSDASVFTKVDSSSVNFGNKWRFKYDAAADVVNLEHFESGNWVTKFSYAA